MTDWDRRQLCSDGACVGVIGPDGTCKVCGRAAANWGDERKRGLLEQDEEDDEAEDEDDDDEANVAAVAEPPAAAGEWADRKLCPDGGCVGVIGGDGKCKVCGRSAA